MSKRIITFPDAHPWKIGMVRAGLVALLGNYKRRVDDPMGDAGFDSQGITWIWDTPPVTLHLYTSTSLAGKITVKFMKTAPDLERVVQAWRDTDAIPDTPLGVQFVNMGTKSGEELAYCEITANKTTTFTADLVRSALITLLGKPSISSERITAWNKSGVGEVAWMTEHDKKIVLRTHPNHPEIMRVVTGLLYGVAA